MVEKMQKKPVPARRRMIWMLLATLLVFGGVFGLKAVMSKGMNEFFDNMPQPAAAVTAHTARQEEWSDAQESVGSFVAINGTDVTTESAGVVKRLMFDPGQPVKAGTVLVQLNSANELAVLKSLEASALLAEVQSKRWRELGKDKLVSQDEVEQRATNAASTRAHADAQRALIAQKTIRAPFDGVLGLRRVNLGQFVDPGDPIVSLQSLDPIYLDFSLPEQQMGAVTEGTRIRASVDALPGEIVEGVVTAVEPQVDTNTRNFKIQATVPNPDHKLRPGTFAHVSFDAGSARQVVVVPQTAISFNPYGNAVYVISRVKRGGGEKDMQGEPVTGDRLVVNQRFVKTGATRGDLIAVTDGLEAGEQVATSGLLKLRNGAEVSINNKVVPTADASPDAANR